MFFFALVLFLMSGWFLPWWGPAPLAFLLGIFLPGEAGRALKVSGAACVAWAALAFLANGHSHGMISPKIAGLFHLPFSGLLYVLMGAIAGSGAFLYFKTGAFLRDYVEARETTHAVDATGAASGVTQSRVDVEVPDLINPRY